MKHAKLAFGLLIACGFLYAFFGEYVVGSCAPRDVAPVECSLHLPIERALDSPNTATIGIAFVIMVHNLKTIKTAIVTIKLLQNPRCYFVVHVDLKVPEPDVDVLMAAIKDDNLHNVKVISTQSIKWGGRELLPASLDGFSVAMDAWPDWHYVFLMSGDCLPLKPLHEIQAQMSKYWPKNNLAIYQQGIESRDEVGTSKRLRIKLTDGEPYDKLVKGLEMVYYGTTWVTLTRPYVKWLRTENFPRNLLLYFAANHIDMDADTGLPSIFEELYFQTAIMHSPFKASVGNADECIRFEKWGGCNYVHEDRPVPCMLGEKDTTEFNNTDCLFARKFVFSSVPTIITNRIPS